MAPLLGTWSVLTQSKPIRIEGHTSNVLAPIQYVQYIKGTVGETTEAGDTYIIPHKLSSITHINAQPITATGTTALYGNGTTEGASIAETATVAGPTQITTPATAGASTVTLTSGSAIADVYNGCYVDISYSNGNVQTVKITDYAVTTTIATLAEPLAQDIAATGTYYTIRGTLLTILSVAVTPRIGFEVIGTF